MRIVRLVVSAALVGIALAMVDHDAHHMVAALNG